jgi:hypothetical protein
VRKPRQCTYCCFNHPMAGNVIDIGDQAETAAIALE